MILRRSNSDPKKLTVIRFTWRNIVAGKSPDIELLAGDTVSIPPSAQSVASRDLLGIIGGLTPLGLLIPH